MKTIGVSIVTFAVLLGLSGAALADIPTCVDYHIKWSGSPPTWQTLKNDYGFDDPFWSEDPTYLQVDNQAMPEPWVKYVFLEVEYDTMNGFPLTPPPVTLESETLPTYLWAESQTTTWPFSWTYSWKIDPQPGWEGFSFQNAGYKNLTYPIISVEVGTWCTPEPTMFVLTALGAVALLRRR